MKLVRFELTIDGINTVGLVTGGFGLGLLSEDDLFEMNRALKIPPKVKTGKRIKSYFTEEGLARFGKLAETAKQNLLTEKNKLHAKLSVVIRNFDEVQKSAIVYKDKWQVAIAEQQ